MNKGAAATIARDGRKIASPSTEHRTWRSAAYDESATRQLHFSYWPVIAAVPTARVTAGLLQHWLQHRSAAMAMVRPVPGFRVTAGVLTKADRFFLAHAASALGCLQSSGIAGQAVIHVSVAGLTDPLLPLYVVSQLQLCGVSLVAVTVALARR